MEMECDEYVDMETTSGDDVNDNEDDTSLPPKAVKSVPHSQPRYKKLGFYPQKEIFCNKYLPYAEQLDDESQRMLTELKESLARAVAQREMTPAIGICMSRLLVYIKLYGLKFSKEDHLKFIKLILSLIEMPDLEPAKLNKFCIVLSQLLRKTSWLSSKDLQIDWRPLYILSNIFLNKNSKKGELYRYFPSLESNIQFIIQQCASYFPKSSTQEILDEIYPKLFPLDTGKLSGAFDLLSIFLSPMHGHELWLKDFIDLWNTYHNPSWNIEIMNLIAVTASQNVGYIDWEPYMPMIFTRILRSIDLPVCYKNMKSARNQQLWSSSVAIWIAYVLSPKSSAQQYLTKFMDAIESYLHPANSGKWLSVISEIVIQLPKYLFDRLIAERYKPHPWKRPTPDEHKLTENCLNEFVDSLKPIAFQAMYSRMNTTDVGKLFKHLADLRPELIIPEVIDRVYTTLDSLTEPHKLTAALQCLVSVSRALVSGHNGYTLGKTHVIPILYATLPGIDPNDFKKTSVTLQFLTSFALLVPIIDCSKAGLYYHNLTEEELLICGQTIEFEGFVLAYLDKIFLLIESSSQDITRMDHTDSDNLRSKLETIAESLLQSSTHGILGQCSDEIILSATKKLVEYIKLNLFEPRVAAHLVASLVRVFARVAGLEIRRSLVPYVISTFNLYLDEHEDVHSWDKASDEILYYLILLMSIARGDPTEVIEMVDDFLPIIDRISKFKCKLTNKYSNAILINILSNVSTMQTLDVRSSPESHEQPLKDFLPIRHWGQKMKVETPIKWYVPNEKARDVCEKIIHRYLPPILNIFEQYVDGKTELSRDDVLRDTSTVLALLKAANFLPNWTEEKPLQVLPTRCPIPALNIVLGFEHLTVNMPNGENVRLSVIKSITKLQKKILKESEDDTKSLKAIILLWERVCVRKQYTTPFDSQLKSYNSLKTFQEYKLTKRIRDIRAILATRILMQQDCRDEMALPEFTESHLCVMRNLLDLSTSHYSAVRSTAQSKLFKLISTFPNSYRVLLDDVVPYLELDSNENHESFKGILYVLCGQRRTRLIVKNDWVCIQKIWLALLKTNLSEKPSVVRLLDMVNDVIRNEFPTVAIMVEIPDNCVELARSLLPNKSTVVTDADVEYGKLELARQNAANLKLYSSILTDILEITHNNSLHWRYGQMASGMIYNLVHITVKYPNEVVRYCVNNLINESIEERKCAIKTIRNVMKQQKREHIKIAVDPFQIAGVPAPADRRKLKPGCRPDNKWLQYDLATLPRNQKEWDEPRFTHKTEGFFGWSPNFSVYAPSAQQPPLNRKREELSEAEQIIYDFFANKANIDKLIGFWSLEEKKGKEKFNRARSFILKGLCDMYGDVLLDYFLEHLARLINDRNAESNHRCAAELMAGIMRGMKHWTFDMTNNLYEKLKPLILSALNNITVETDVFWGTCFATAAENFDPRRQWWLHEVLMENPLRETTSFIDCSRLYCLQGPFNQHVWRMNSVSHRLLNYLRPYLNHSFQNVRERLGSILINIFEADLEFPGGPQSECPRIKDMMEEILKKIQILHKDMPTVPVKGELLGQATANAIQVVANAKAEGIPEVSNTEHDQAIRLFKTVCQWIVGVLNRNTNGNLVEYFELLPFACRLERSEADAELAETCSSLLAMLSQGLTLAKCMGQALKKIDQVSMMSSWSARLAVIDVLQVLVFNNMPIVLSNDEWVQQVQTIVLRLLEDAILEVREKAAQVLGGLLHCSFLPATDKLLELFKQKCRTKVIKNTSRRVLTNCSVQAVAAAVSGIGITAETQEAESVRVRHMGVLGLCAFISAYPYDIPDFVPDVFEHLGAHLNDPQPIPSTIRKTVGDFKRTHHENWAIHQLKFTEDQLAVLSDLTIPPSYYA